MITGIVVAVIFFVISLGLVSWSAYNITWWWRSLSNDGVGFNFVHVRDSLSDESAIAMVIGVVILTVLGFAFFS